MTLHSVLIKVHEDKGIQGHQPDQCHLSTRWIDKSVGHKTESPPNFAVFQGHRYLETPILGVRDVFVSRVNILIPIPLTPLTVYMTVP
jgi:hypothetical protein